MIWKSCVHILELTTRVLHRPFIGSTRWSMPWPISLWVTGAIYRQPLMKQLDSSDCLFLKLSALFRGDPGDALCF